MSILPSIARVEAGLFKVRNFVIVVREKSRFAQVYVGREARREKVEQARPKSQLRRCSSLSRVMQDPSTVT